MSWLFQPLLLVEAAAAGTAVGTAAGTGTAAAVSDHAGWNPSDKSANITLSNNNKTLTTVSGVVGCRSHAAHLNETAGKFYAEFLLTTLAGGVIRVGINNLTASITSETGASCFLRTDNNCIYANNVIIWTLGSAIVDGDIVSVAWNSETERIWFRVNGGDWNDDSGANNPAAGTGGFNCSFAAAVDHALWFQTTSGARVVTLRTENADFTYSGPASFTSWMGEAFDVGSVGDVDGVGTAAATSAAIKGTTGTAAGIATASGVSPAAITDAAGTAAGVGAATAVGEAFTGIPDAWSLADKSAGVTLSNSDRTATTTTLSGVRSTTRHASGTAGKFYAELVFDTVVSTDPVLGLNRAGNVSYTASSETVRVLPATGNILLGSSTNIGNVGGACVSGNVIGLAWDAGAERIWFRKNNGLWNNDAAANPATGTNGLDVSVLANEDFALWMASLNAGASRGATVRAENADFAYSGPSGFTSWMGEALAATSDAVGDADGVGAAAATGQQIATVSAAVSGVGAAAATGAKIAAASSALSGVGTASAIGAQTATTTASASGVGAASATGEQVRPSIGTAPGVGLATATGDVGDASVSGVGTAAGVGVVSAEGRGIQTAQGAAAGVGTAAATGGQIATASGTAAATGAAAGSSSAAAYVSGVGAATGVGTAAATGVAASAAGAGTAAGLGTAAAAGQQTASAAGAVAGTGAAAATSGAIAATAGTASGIGSAAAEGFEGAVVFNEAAGSANGVGAAAGIGFAIQPSATADERIIVAAAELRVITAAAETRTITPSAENRTIVAVAEDRTIEAVAEDRDIETSEIQRSLAA